MAGVEYKKSAGSVHAGLMGVWQSLSIHTQSPFDSVHCFHPQLCPVSPVQSPLFGFQRAPFTLLLSENTSPVFCRGRKGLGVGTGMP